MLFVNEQEMQNAAEQIAREIYRDLSPYRDQDIARFKQDVSNMAQRWKNNQAIKGVLNNFDPTDHYIILSYTRLML